MSFFKIFLLYYPPPSSLGTQVKLMFLEIIPQITSALLIY